MNSANRSKDCENSTKSLYMTRHVLDLCITQGVKKKVNKSLWLEPGRWHNGSAFVFCSCDRTFETEPSPTSAHACGELTGCAPAAKRSTSVAPEVNLGECTLHSPLQK